MSFDAEIDAHLEIMVQNLSRGLFIQKQKVYKKEETEEKKFERKLIEFLEFFLLFCNV